MTCNNRNSNRRMDYAIGRGLEYLQNLFESKPWAFSTTHYSNDRSTFIEDRNNKHTRYSEKFTHFIALDLLGNHLPSSVRSKLTKSLLPSAPSTINYFVDATTFPDDADTTALGYASLLKSNLVKPKDILPAAEIVFSNVNDQGVVGVYFKSAEDRKRNMVCACVCANVLHLGYILRQETELQKTENYVFDWLQSGHWKQGTTYYPNGFPFLYFCSKFVMMNYNVQENFKPLLLSATENSVQDCKLTLDFALILLTLENLGKRDYSMDISETLLGLQEEDGSWPVDAFWGSSKGVLYGSKALSTIFAVTALISATKFVSSN